jgi:hypothetical protein
VERDRRGLLRDGWRRLRAEPVIPILVVATMVHIVRRAPLDTAVFGGTAVLIVVDRSKTLITPAPATRRFTSLDRRWLDVAAIVFGILVGGLRHGSWPVLMAISVPGVLAAMAVLGARPRADAGSAEHPPAPRGSRAWVVVLVALALWELSAFVQQPSPTIDSYDHPVLSSLIDPLLGVPWHRAIAIAVWFALGTRLVLAVVAHSEADQRRPVVRVVRRLRQEGH